MASRETNGYAQSQKDNDNGIMATNGASSRFLPRQRTRPPTVDEALPYSPLPIVPFNSDIVPLPTIGLRSSASIFVSNHDKVAGRQDLESLNLEATELGPTSKRLAQTLQNLKNLLQPEQIPQYKFKTGPKFISQPGGTTIPATSLSPFAQMVYDATQVDYSYPPLGPPTANLQKASKTKSSPKKSSSLLARAEIATQPLPKSELNHDAYRSNSAIAMKSSQNSAHQSRHQSVNNHATTQRSGVGAQPLLKNKDRQSNELDVTKPRVVVEGQLPKQRTTQTNGSLVAHAAEKKPKMSSEEITPSATPQGSQGRTSSNIAVVIPVPRQDKFQEGKPAPILLPQRLISKPSLSQNHSLKPQTQTTPGLKPTSSNLAVVIPGPDPTFRAADYEILPDSPGTPQKLSKKRQQNSAADSYRGISMTYDQRQKADLSLRAFEDYLRDIFENEDQISADSVNQNNFFAPTNDGFGLTSFTQYKVEGLLQKVIELKRFSQVPLDDLLRLQKLSEQAVKDAESADIKVEDSMSDSEVNQIIGNLPVAETGLKSARTSLRIMCGGREDKQLYSEDIIISALSAFKNAMDTCIVPIVEMRHNSDPFKFLLAEKKAILAVLTICRKVLSLLANLVATIELSDTVINTLEFISTSLIFVENAHAEKDSVLGIAKFDNIRVEAMEVLSQIFLHNPMQRQGIFDEILTSLEKLPTSKQSARQFRLPEGGNIQLVSALVMRLIQTSASKPDNAKAKRRNNTVLVEDGKPLVDGDDQPKNTINSESRAEQQAVTAIQELGNAITPLLDSAKANANFVVNYIVTRALKSTKGGDTPYRNLLDLFVADFITCLPSPDWPAAELLLRILLFAMVRIIEGDKSAAPAKNMALETLGAMGAAISELSSHVRKTAATLETNEDELGKSLAKLASATLEKKAAPGEMVSWDYGPFRTTLEFLDERCSTDPQLSSAIGYYMAEWGSKIVSTYDVLNEEDDPKGLIERDYGRLAYRLRMMVADQRWLSTEYTFDSSTPVHARLAYCVTVLESHFCGSFGRVLTILLSSMISDQATVRSKSMKSVNQVLETDPSILDREPAVKRLLLRCINDTSSLVRDTALGMISKCITLRPSLEAEMINPILERVNDASAMVRKRVLKLAKDIYLKNEDKEVRSRIADSLLHRVQDQDESVLELARQTIEDVWMSPFYKSTSSSNPDTKSKLAMADHVTLIMKTIQRDTGIAGVLEKVLQNMLSQKSKQSESNFQVCKALVATTFETVIDNTAEEAQNITSTRDALNVLTVFAKADAKLFTFEQIQLLTPYIGNVTTNDDKLILRYVVVVFRHVLPHLSTIHNEFLISVRGTLLPQLSRMPKLILDDIIPCLWIICSSLNDLKHLGRVSISTMQGVLKHRKTDFNSKGADPRMLIRLLLLLGTLGKHCDLDSQIEMFKKAIPTLKGESVSRLMADIAAPFTSPDQPLDIRKAAFEAVGMICQSWPKNFNSANISTAIKEVFDSQLSELEVIIMDAFKDFLLLEEKRSEVVSSDMVGVAAEGTATLGVMGGAQGDGVAIGIAQVYLKDFTRIALSSQKKEALLATELIASITRQGLVHPKECGSTLIALETSKHPKISDLAFHGHKSLHEKYESILEREYMRAVQLAYEYQRDVVEDTHGATLNPFAPKLGLMIEVMKISKTKSRKKFFEALCERIDFDPMKMTMDELAHHLSFSNFIIENMVFFEYLTVDELLGAINAMERVASGAGTGVLHTIETEILMLNLEQPTQEGSHNESQALQPITDQRLLQIAGSSAMLSIVWEARTYLRRQYGLKVISKSKSASKDLNKPPTKVAFVNGDKFWEAVSATMASLATREGMLAQCRAFVEQLSVDEEFKIAAEGDEDGGIDMNMEEDEDEDGDETSANAHGRKRKAGGGTPGGRKKRARSSGEGPKQKGKPKGSGNANSRASVTEDDEDSF